MKVIRAARALTPQGWERDVEVAIDRDGRIASVQCNVGFATGPAPFGALLPAPANLHSHTFQRAMAGLSEGRSADAHDSFWTWRKVMFRFLDHLTPDHVQAIAAFAQMEMLESGYACSTEFHYLHHRPGGAPYARLAEMSERIAAAAGQSGIGLTLLPVFYRHGGCDGRAPGPGQVRFANDRDRFARLFEQARTALTPLPADTAIGVAPHSLRAVGRDDLAPVAALSGGGGVVHMHLAEQPGEVEEVRASRGKRPVEWLLDNIAVDDRWCLIHCTQMLPHETISLAATGAVAGLCPITEANLGDGIFDAVRWLEHGGRFGIGSDSNIRISLSEELRMLEYSQRLRDHSRAALATPTRSTGRRLFQDAATGGAQAAGRDSGAIAPGLWADLMALDTGRAGPETCRGDRLLDHYIFAGDDRMVSDVWSAGRHLVRAGRHVARDAITAAYRRCMRTLGDAL